MHVWYHLPTIFNQRRALRLVALLTLCVALITTLFFTILFSQNSFAAPGTNQTISYQGRLLTSGGTPVADGYYNIQFKIYQDGAGTTAGNPGGTLKWTETYINNGGNNAIYVKNGYLSANLGSLNPFGTNVDWNQDTLWLSMNVAGSSTSCTTFNSSPCVADGEMLPMKRITSTPLALNSARLGGISADGFLQNTTTQQTADFNISGTGIAGTLVGTNGIISSSFDRADSGTLSIGGTNATELLIGSTLGSSSTTLQGGSGGVTIASNGTFGINTTGGDDTLTIDTEGIITTSEASQLIINGSAHFNQGITVQGETASTISSASGQNLVLSSDSGVSIGSGSGSGEPVLLKLDQSATTPLATGEAVLGSMYYDTTVGKLQCYEADGWGACSSSPDNFVTLSPTYSNAVTSSTGIGDFTSDICSDDLDINDGSSAQPTICGTNETYNFYKWTTAETSAQTKDIYVTYQLPSNFTGFVEGSTSLVGRTDDTDASVAYRVYKNTGSGLVACGSVVSVSTGSQSTWQKVNATGSADPYNCSFSSGDSLVFKISLTADHTTQETNAYVSTLSFAFKDN